MTMGTIIIFSAICGGVGYAVASEQNKAAGAILGLVFGPIGIVVAAVMKD